MGLGPMLGFSFRRLVCSRLWFLGIVGALIAWEEPPIEMDG